jgi:hypothetical protein
MAVDGLAKRQFCNDEIFVENRGYVWKGEEAVESVAVLTPRRAKN